MFHICFAADENYIKYTAVLITSIVKSTDTSRKFVDFFSNNANGGGDFDIRNSAENADLPSLRGDLSPKQSTSLNFTKNFTENSQVVDCFEFANANSHAQRVAEQNDGIETNSSLASYKKLNFHTLNDDEKCEGYIFHILSDFVSENSREKLANLAKKLSEIYPCEIQIHIYSEGEKFKEIATFAGHLTFYRLLISDFLPEIKRALYLDVDMLVCGDLRELFTLDLSGKIAAVVKDIKEARLHSNKASKFGFDFYFNAGLLLLNLDEFRKQNLKEKCFEILHKYKPYYADQDALNLAISRDFAVILPARFNFFSTAYEDGGQGKFECDEAEFKAACESPVVVHFAGDCKAWDFVALGFKWWQIALQTPFFSQELAEIFKQKCHETHMICVKFKDEFILRKIFDKYLGSVILSLSGSLFGYLKMPFVVKRIFRDKERGKLSAKKMQNTLNTNCDENLLLEFAKFATRAYHRRGEFKLIFLPLKIRKIKAKFRRV